MKDLFTSATTTWTILAIVLILLFAAVLVVPYMGHDATGFATGIAAAAPAPASKSALAPALTSSTRTRAAALATPGALGATRTAAPKPAATAATSTTTPAANPGEDDLDPVDIGRLALSFVGIDPEAEAAWLEVINDPSVDAEDRKNLIEDLNEDGFPDPKNLTQADLPLIEARIALIEKLAPQALDPTNAAAFEEAHKDLLAMRAKLKPPVAAPASDPRTESAR